MTDPELGEKNQPPTAADGKSQDVLPSVLGEKLRSAGIDTRDPKITRAIELTMTMTAVGQLPMPPAEILEEYDDRFPGLVDRFVQWTEEQRRHRFDLEKLQVSQQEARLNRAQIFTLTVSIFGLATSGYVGVNGSWVVASVLAVVSIGGPTAAIWLARGQQTDDEDD